MREEMMDDSATNIGVTGIDHHPVLDRFRSFINEESSFRTFIKTCNTRSRQGKGLTYSQSEIWGAFIVENAEFKEMSDSDVQKAFYVCHIHLKPLRKVNVPIRKGVSSISRTREAELLIASEAYYSIPLMIDSSAWGASLDRSVDHCEECVSRRIQLEDSGISDAATNDVTGASD